VEVLDAMLKRLVTATIAAQPSRPEKDCAAPWFHHQQLLGNGYASGVLVYSVGRVIGKFLARTYVEGV
jgi:hypothetical protein